MFKSKISIEEFEQAIYMLGYNQYNHLIEWFEEKNININSNQLFFLCEIIITRIMEKVSKEKNFKIKDNFDDDITSLLFNSIDPNLSIDDNEALKEYVLITKDEVKELIGDGNKKIIDLVDYFLNEIILQENYDDSIKIFFVDLFSNWQELCYELVKKYKIK